MQLHSFMAMPQIHGHCRRGSPLPFYFAVEKGVEPACCDSDRRPKAEVGSILRFAPAWAARSPVMCRLLAPVVGPCSCLPDPWSRSRCVFLPSTVPVHSFVFLLSTLNHPFCSRTALTPKNNNSGPDAIFLLEHHSRSQCSLFPTLSWDFASHHVRRC